MEKVRIGVIGMGGMGSNHAAGLASGEVSNAELTAVCDTDPSRLDWSRKNRPGVKTFDNTEGLIKSGEADAVIIATPHYTHPEIAIKAFNFGLHVLTEKPAGVYTGQVKEMNAAAEKSGKVFGIMYNQRTNPLYQKLRDLVINGELGGIKRIIWIITSWYRPQSYFDSGGWRASWAGEGGGVLLNQDPHQLDLWQWICGMPKRVRAFMSFGKYHDIEVEDDVTAYLEYGNGATGLFVTSTGETPGTNRLEISGDRGKLVLEDGKLVFWRNRVDERKFNVSWAGGFGQPECWKCEIPISGVETGHIGIIRNWVNSVMYGEKLLAPGFEGIKGLMLSNAMHLSAWTDDWAELPVDDDLFYQKLKQNIDGSKYKKSIIKDIMLDVNASYQKSTVL